MRMSTNWKDGVLSQDFHKTVCYELKTKCILAGPVTVAPNKLCGIPPHPDADVWSW